MLILVSLNSFYSLYSFYKKVLFSVMRVLNLLLLILYLSNYDIISSPLGYYYLFCSITRQMRSSIFLKITQAATQLTKKTDLNYLSLQSLTWPLGGCIDTAFALCQSFTK